MVQTVWPFNGKLLIRTESPSLELRNQLRNSQEWHAACERQEERVFQAASGRWERAFAEGSAPVQNEVGHGGMGLVRDRLLWETTKTQNRRIEDIVAFGNWVKPRKWFSLLNKELDLRVSPLKEGWGWGSVSISTLGNRVPLLCPPFVPVTVVPCICVW